MKVIKKFITLLFCLCVPVRAAQFATQLITTLIDDGEPAEYRGEIDKKGKLLKLGTIAKDLYIHLIEGQSILIVNSSLLHYLMAFLKINDNPLELMPQLTIDPSKWIKRQVTDNLYVLAPIDYIKNTPHYQDLKKLDLKNLGSPYTAEELAIGIQLKGKTISDKDFIDPSSYKAKESYPKKYIDLPDISWKTVTQEIKGNYIVTKTITHTQPRQRSVSWISQHFIENLDNIFIPLGEYKKINVFKYAPVPVIIASGHGSTYEKIDKELQYLKKKYGSHAQNEINRLEDLKKKGVSALLGGQIAGFASQDFGDFVGYVTKNVQSPLLFFNTCYGSEVNVHAALNALAEKEKKDLKDLKIPSIIISGAISNAPAYDTKEATQLFEIVDTYDQHGNIMRDKDGKKITKAIPLSKTLDRPIYKKFLDTLNKNKTIDDDLFIEALDYIYPLYGDVSSYNNIPIIKYPDEIWRPLHMPDKILIISSSFIQKYNNQKSVDIAKIFDKQKKPYPRVVLVGVPEVPFELVISGNNLEDLPAFISYLPGDALHHFSKLDTAGYTLTDVANNFFNIKNLADDKIFLIDELVVINNLSKLSVGLNKQVTLKNVVVIHKAPDDYDQYPQYIVHFSYDNKDWSSEMTFDPNNGTFKTMNDTLAKDTSGVVKKQWDDLEKLSQNYASHIQSLSTTKPITQPNKPPTKPTTPTNQPINKPTTTNTVNVLQQANDALLLFAQAAMDVAKP